MKHGLLVVAITLIFSNGYAQNNNVEEIKTEKQILRKAKSFGDPNVTIKSLYALMVLEGENSTYKDTLAYTYFSARNYGPCFMVTTEVLKRDPNHVEMLEMNAISLESLGALQKAEEVYSKLLTFSNNNYHAYTIANLNYRMKKYDEAYAAIKKAESLNDEGKFKVTFSINQNHTQQVELLAAIPYLKGLIELDLKNQSAAKASFEKAIKIQPDFVLAKDNLEALSK